MANSHVLIRFATIEEAPSIALILQQSFAEFESLYTEDAFKATTPTTDQLLQRWSEGPVWIALENHRIVGTIAAVPKIEGLYIRSMAILPEARGKDIGKLLLKFVESFAANEEFKRMFLNTTPFLLRAIRLYEQFGFQRIDERQHELFGTPLFTMEKLL